MQLSIKSFSLQVLMQNKPNRQDAAFILSSNPLLPVSIKMTLFN